MAVSSVTIVHTAAELAAAYAGAKDGDRIELAAGNYGAVTLSGRSFANGITITSADPNNHAVLTDQIVIKNSSNVTLTGIDLDAAKLGSSARANWVNVSFSSGVTVSDMTITGHIPTAAEGMNPNDPAATRLDPIAGYAYTCGLIVSNSTGTVVRNIDFQDLRIALTITDADNTLVDNVDIHDVREGINLNDVRDLKIQNSFFHDFTPWVPASGQGDHADMIQYWGVNSQIGVRNLTITDNVFLQPETALPTQTIFGDMSGGGSGVLARNFVITDNVIVNGHLNGISLGNVVGGQISGNLILPNELSLNDPAQIDTPAIGLFYSRNIAVFDNTYVPFGTPGRVVRMDSGTQASGTISIQNNTELSVNPKDPLFWHAYAQAVLTGSVVPTPPPPTPGLDTSGMNATDLALFLSAAANIKMGTDNADAIQADDSDTFIFGLNGNDLIKEWRGNDVLSGGGGSDRFVVNLNLGGPQSRDLILDLDFTEKDVLMVTSDAGSFSDAADPSNQLRTLSGGAIAWINSLADLKELVASGAMTAATAADGDGLALTFADAPGRVIELAGFDLYDLA